MENITNETVVQDNEATVQTEPDGTQATYAPIPCQNDPVVGTGAFFGLEFLLALPLIGFLCSIIFSFAPKNRNLKHYARAKLIWALISLVLSVLLIIGAILLLRTVPQIVSSELGIEVEDMQEIADIIDELPGIIDQFGGIDGIAGLVGDAGDLMEVVGQLGDAEGLGEILGQIGEIEGIEQIISEIGELENIEEVIGELENIENIESVIGELENIENIEELAEQINDPDTVEQLLDAFKNYVE